jgi:2-polyprenyl-3-methyl-5-hydroxy-6-metoxy-1,4-benzoquinol methylase
MSSTNAPDESATEKHNKNVNPLRDLMKEQGNQSGWDHAWNAGITPWEKLNGIIPQPALVHTCEKDESTKHLVPRGRGDGGRKAIVPGCGRGQDVEYLAKLGFTSTGIDISQKAVERAKEVRHFILQR